VVSTPLKKNSQMGLFFPTEWKNNKNMFQTNNQYMYNYAISYIRKSSPTTNQLGN
jgi:hypothetical protein